MNFLLIYILILLTAFVFQRKLLYFPAHFTREQQEQLMVGSYLEPWPSQNDPRGMIGRIPLANIKGTVLVFHGNAGAAIHRTYYHEALQRLGYRVIIAEYPGYGLRDGTPSETILIEDGIITAKRVSDEFKEPLFLCGESLGSGIVAGVVASGKVPVKGLLLISPFDAMTNVAQHHYWFLLAKWLLLDKYENVSKLIHFEGRIALIIAGQDVVIPNRRSMALFDALREPKKLWRFEHAGHNSLPLEPENPWWQDTMTFIDN